ncbi:hypothetical protein LOK49_LG03G01155 [Camellia lanceoleosa]|uniref:Uncharacterized protein n=1 Tax=Camellia lanceoleosa TaxID=1840588 RepID=A0ACC0I7Q3_9ERIC|nr:hypothetical protein LOK49_LG03G01155 [Camellia lanceoleosa]
MEEVGTEVGRKVGRWTFLCLASGQVEVRPLGDQAFLFVFSFRREAKTVLRRRWTLDGCDLLLEWWTPLVLLASGSESPPGSRVWIRVTGLPLHLRGEEVYRVIGDQCGGLVEADESSADLGSLRLCVTGLAKLPSTILLRWGSWSFSLPIWVEVQPQVVPVAPSAGEEGGSDLGLKGRDLRRTYRSFAKFVGVNEYRQRFARPIEFKGNQVRVAPNSNIGSVVGSLGVLPDQQVGRSEAQRTDAVSLGQKRWAPVHHLPQVGQAGGHVLFNDPGCGLGLVVKDPNFYPTGQSNPDLSRVCASLRDGLELRRTLSAMEPSPESGQPQAKITVEDFGGSSLLIGSTVGASPTHPELSRVRVSPCDGLELHRTHTVMAVSPESGRPQAKAAVEDFGDCSYSLGSSVGVSPTFFPALVADEQCLQQLCCGEGCEIEEDAVDGSWSSRVDQLALVVHPVVVDAEVEVGDVVVEDGINSPLVDFHEDVIPSSEEVSRWVLSRINEGECPELPSGDAFEPQ